MRLGLSVSIVLVTTTALPVTAQTNEGMSARPAEGPRDRPEARARGPVVLDEDGQPLPLAEYLRRHLPPGLVIEQQLPSVDFQSVLRDALVFRDPTTTQQVIGSDGSHIMADLAPNASVHDLIERNAALPASRACLAAADQVLAAPTNLTAKRTYADSCFVATFGAAADPLVVSLQRNAAMLQITQDQAKQVCSATFIAADRVATARHCLFKEFNGSRYRYSYALDQVKVFPLSPAYEDLEPIAVVADPAYSVTENGVTYFTSPANPKVGDDFVVLKLASSLRGGVWAHAAVSAQPDVTPGSQLLLAGFNRVIWEASGGGGDLSSYRRAYRVDRGATCMAVLVSADCIVHGCQSFKETSGAALFVTRSDGTLQLVGTLVGANPQLERCGGPSKFVSINFAARAP